jgi:hypothetical protein
VPWTENDVRWVAARLLPDLHDIYQDAARYGRLKRQLEAVHDEITNFRERSVALDRITEKLKRASGVAQRAALNIESEADKLIAREDELAKRTSGAFAPHNAVLDGRNRELDQLSDALQILSNADPLPVSGDGLKEPPVNPPLGLFSLVAEQAPTIHASQAAIDLIVTEEDGNKLYYTRHYQHFEWPAGASGPTVGIGYDCGYVSPNQIKKDWQGIISDASILMLIRASGLKGQAAHTFVQQYGNSVTITWDQAMAEFMQRGLPHYEALNRQELPNYDMLPPDCAGALDSLSYNRGVGAYHLPGDRYLEMRAIYDHMTRQNFKLIPREILGMRRLWPVGGDLWRRREHEAALFSQGLERKS